MSPPLPPLPGLFPWGGGGDDDPPPKFQSFPSLWSQTLYMYPPTPPPISKIQRGLGEGVWHRHLGQQQLWGGGGRGHPQKALLPPKAAWQGKPPPFPPTFPGQG